ncbi:uncharacterized protein [Taeniopygia guttata]|uniref:uncharacterized protein n=1 Tax=Taeniopygia guttata TaxID=59729 RepID=UPI003BB97151
MNGEEGAARRRSARSGRRAAGGFKAPPLRGVRGGHARRGRFPGPPAHTPVRPGPSERDQRAAGGHGQRSVPLRTVPYRTVPPGHTGQRLRTAPYRRGTPGSASGPLRTVPYRRGTPGSAAAPLRTAPYRTAGAHRARAAGSAAAPIRRGTPGGSGQHGGNRGLRSITAGDSLRGTTIELVGSGRGPQGPSGTAWTQLHTPGHTDNAGTDGQGQPGTGGRTAGHSPAQALLRLRHGAVPGDTPRDTEGHGMAPHTQPPHPPPRLPLGPCPRGEGRERALSYGLSQRGELVPDGSAVQPSVCGYTVCRPRCAGTRCADPGGLGELGKSFLTEKENQKKPHKKCSQALPSRSDAGGSGKGPGEALVPRGKGLSPGVVEHQGCVPGHSWQSPSG